MEKKRDTQSPKHTQNFMEKFGCQFTEKMTKKQEDLVQECLCILNSNIEEKSVWEHQVMILKNPQDPPSQNIGSTYQIIPQFDPTDILLVLQEEKVPLKRDNFENQDSALIENAQEDFFGHCLLTLDKSKSIPKNIDFPENKWDQGQSAPEISHKCSCKNSKCLKMYCECFRGEKFCTPQCGCTSCDNLPENQTKRSAKIKSILSQEPYRFSDMNSYRGCQCSKSQCSKNYCDCYFNGLVCGKYCKCKNCLNGKKEKKPKESDRGRKSKGTKKKFTIDI